MNQKIKKFYHFFLERIKEPTTWQGIGFIFVLFGCREAGFSYGDAAAFGGLVSAFLKTMIPDDFGKKDE